MAKKKSSINFKQILMDKGERYGFYVAGGFLLLFLFLGGMKAINSESSASIVKNFDKGVKTIEQKIATGNEQPPPIPGVVYSDPTVANIPFTVHAARNMIYDPSTNELTRRMNPHLLPPTEAQVDFVRGSVGVYDIIEEGGKRLIGIIKERPRSANDTRKIPVRIKQGSRQPNPPQAIPPVPVPPPNAGGGRSNRGMGGMGGPLGMQNVRSTESFVEYKDITDKDIDQVTFAENISPQRMVVVSLAIPYKQQVEIYRKALRAQRVEELSDYPEYRGFSVERRMLSLDGKTVEQDWTPLNLQATFGDLHSKTIEFEPEYPPREMKRELQMLYQRILPPDEFELLVPRPKLKRGEYAGVNLPSVTKALETLLASGQTATDVRTQTEKTITEDNIFKRGQSETQQPGGVPGGRGLGGGPAVPGGKRMIGPGPGQPGVPNQQMIQAEAEESWLMRFIDVTTTAGHAYQYRVSLRALNPNYRKPAKELATPSLAEKEFIQSDWFEIPTMVVAPPEEFLYAAAKDDKNHRLTEKMPPPGQWDDTWVQMQKWYATIRPLEYSYSLPFGEWLVADIRAVRGQYIGDSASIMLPLWHMERGMFLLRENAKKRSTAPTVMLNAGPKPEPTWTVDLAPTPPVLLVDFEGGSGTYFGPKNRPWNDSAGVEMLFMTADGKLHVARSGADMNDADRVKRETGWKTWIDTVKQETLADQNRAPGDGRGGIVPPGGR